MTLKEALVFTLKFEGGLSDHPDDPGGLTNMGITHKVYSSWLASKNRPNKSVRNITREEVEQIYEERYWDPMRAEWLSDPLALTVFDTAVNLGVGGCTRRLQIALGVPVTGKWTQAISDKIHKADQVKVALAICKLRIAKRYERVEKEESQKVFLKGWLNRDNALIREVKKLAGITALSEEEEDDIQEILKDWTKEQLNEVGSEDEDREPLTEY